MRSKNLGTYLKFDQWFRNQVFIPEWMRRMATLRRHNHVTVFVPPIDEGCSTA